MGYGVGIDLGTSFTSAAVSGPDGTRMVPLGPEVIVPSLAGRTPDGTILTGTTALASELDPAALARGFKRRLGDPTPLVVGDVPIPASALMAAQLRDTLTAVTGFVGEPPTSVVLTCPAIWGPYRRTRFAEVPMSAGVTDYHLVTEPEAAATHYAAERRLGDGAVVALYDLGGGTFDTTILHINAGRMEILGRPEGIEHLGGIDIDETLFGHLNTCLDGALDELDPGAPSTSGVLAETRALCVRAKEKLSVEPDVRLTVPLPSRPREISVTRRELNTMIRPSIQLTVDGMRRTIDSAGLTPDDLSAVLLAGGSSRIPLVSQLLTEELGKPVRVTLHPKFTVALGAAAIAARRDTAKSSPPSETPRRIPSQAAAPDPFEPPILRTWRIAVAALAVALIVLVVLLVSGGASLTAWPETPAPPANAGG
jgi:molecular chaperone DnaK